MPAPGCLFAILFFWQLPHFFAIAWMYRDDYARAGFQMISSDDATGARSASQSVFFCMILFVVAGLPAFIRMATVFYLLAELLLGGIFIAVAMRFLKTRAHVGRAATVYHIDYLFAASSRRTRIDPKHERDTATLDRQSARAGTLWKATLIAIPILTLVLFYCLRQLEVNALRQRTVSAYGSVPEFHADQSGREKFWLGGFARQNLDCGFHLHNLSRTVSDDQQPDERIAKAAGENRRASGFVHRRSGKGHAGRSCAPTPKSLQAEPGRWDFLTGPQSTHLQFVAQRIQTRGRRQKRAVPIHSTRMILVDRHGAIRGYYDAVEPGCGDEAGRGYDALVARATEVIVGIRRHGPPLQI